MVEPRRSKNNVNNDIVIIRKNNHPIKNENRLTNLPSLPQSNSNSSHSIEQQNRNFMQPNQRTVAHGVIKQDPLHQMRQGPSLFSQLGDGMPLTNSKAGSGRDVHKSSSMVQLKSNRDQSLPNMMIQQEGNSAPHNRSSNVLPMIHRDSQDSSLYQTLGNTTIEPQSSTYAQMRAQAPMNMQAVRHSRHRNQGLVLQPNKVLASSTEHTPASSYVYAPPVPVHQKYIVDLRSSSDASTQKMIPKSKQGLSKLIKTIHDANSQIKVGKLRSPFAQASQALDESQSEYFALKEVPSSSEVTKSAKVEGKLIQNTSSQHRSNKHRQNVTEEIYQSASCESAHEKTESMHREMEERKQQRSNRKRKNAKNLSHSSVLRQTQTMEPLLQSDGRLDSDKAAPLVERQILKTLERQQEQDSVGDSQEQKQRVSKTSIKLQELTSNMSKRGRQAPKTGRHLFDMNRIVDHQSSHLNQTDGSPSNYLQEMVNQSSNIDQITDPCMQIVSQALSKSYYISLNFACQLIVDIQQQIQCYTQQVKPTNTNGHDLEKFALDPSQSGNFYLTISSRLQQKADIIRAMNSDLTPSLSIVLLGMQRIQSDQTKMDALKCLIAHVQVKDGIFRNKVWSFIKSTSIKREESDTAQTDTKKKSEVRTLIEGFIKCIHDMIDQNQNHELSALACRTIILVAQKHLKEFFIGQLPTLFSDKMRFIQMMNDHIGMYVHAMKESKDEIKQTDLLQKFIAFDIPNFLVAKCIYIIESNLMQLNEKRLNDILPTSPSKQQKASNQKVKFSEGNSIAISLLIQLWTIMPSLFSGQIQVDLLLEESETDDFGLTQRLNQRSSDSGQNNERRGKLGSKILNLIKKSSKRDKSFTLRCMLVTKLFSLLDSLLKEQQNEFVNPIYRLLVYLLVEWHHKVPIREHLLVNFTDLLTSCWGQEFSIDNLVEPLCTVILQNLEDQSDAKPNNYLTMIDFTFMWSLANNKRLTAKSAVAICKVMQFYMLRRDLPQYCAVAEKIFNKLISRHPDQMQSFLKKHSSKAVAELAVVDKTVKSQPKTETSNFSPSKVATKPGQDKIDMQLQLHFLYKHILLLAKGVRVKQQDEATILRSHIIANIERKLQKHSDQLSDSILISLLKKLKNNDTVSSATELTITPQRKPKTQRSSAIQEEEKQNDEDQAQGNDKQGGQQNLQNKSLNSTMMRDNMGNHSLLSLSLANLPLPRNSKDKFAQRTKTRDNLPQTNKMEQYEPKLRPINRKHQQTVQEFPKTITQPEQKTIGTEYDPPTVRPVPKQEVKRFEKTIKRIKAPARADLGPSDMTLNNLSQESIDTSLFHVTDRHRNKSPNELDVSNISRLDASQKSILLQKEPDSKPEIKPKKVPLLSINKSIVPSKFGNPVDQKQIKVPKQDDKTQIEDQKQGPNEVLSQTQPQLHIPHSISDYALKILELQQQQQPGKRSVSQTFNLPETAPKIIPPQPKQKSAEQMNEPPLYHHKRSITLPDDIRDNNPVYPNNFTQVDLSQSVFLQNGNQTQKAKQGPLHIPTERVHSKPEIRINETNFATSFPSVSTRIISSPVHFQTAMNSPDRLNESSLSIYGAKGQITPARRQQYRGLPTSLPKALDFWRGAPLQNTKYGDVLHFETPGSQLSQIQPMHNEMSDSQANHHNKRLIEYQKHLLLNPGAALEQSSISLPKVIHSSQIFGNSQKDQLVPGDNQYGLNTGTGNLNPTADKTLSLWASEKPATPMSMANRDQKRDGDLPYQAITADPKPLMITSGREVDNNIQPDLNSARKDNKEGGRLHYADLSPVLKEKESFAFRYGYDYSHDDCSCCVLTYTKEIQTSKEINSDMLYNKDFNSLKPDDLLYLCLSEAEKLRLQKQALPGLSIVTDKQKETRQNQVIPQVMSLTINADFPRKLRAHFSRMANLEIPAEKKEKYIDYLNHSGMANLTPNQQAMLQSYLFQPKLPPPEQKMLDHLKDRIINGKPLDLDHPGVQNLTRGQGTKLNEILRRKNNGETLSPDEKKLLQNIQNLMVHAQPLDERHPGYDKLPQRSKDKFAELKNLRRHADNQPKDKVDQLEKVLGAMQLGSAPYDLTHEGYHNLVPGDNDTFKDLLKKKPPLNNWDGQEMDRFKDIMRPAVPYDKNHPGHDSLTPSEQKKLANLNLKKAGSEYLPLHDEKDLNKLHKMMDNPIPFDENHPGWNDLLPKEKRDFVQNQEKLDNDQELIPSEDLDQGNMKEIMRNGRPYDENHPGWNNLTPKQKKRFKALKKLEDPGPLTPQEQDEMNNLIDIMNGPKPKGKHKKKRGDGNGSESSLYTECSDDILTPSQPKIEIVKPDDDELTPEERARLTGYLGKRLFKDPLSEDEEDDFGKLLKRDKDIDRNLSPEQKNRLKELVRMLYRGVDLEPEEEAELVFLHAKQNNGVGNLTPRQHKLLNKIKDYEDQGEPLNPAMESAKKYYEELQQMPSPLSRPLESEIKDMEDKNKQRVLTPKLKNRLKDFWRMRYHPQLLNPEDRALFYEMKDLESLPELQPQQEKVLHALRKKFNCLPLEKPQVLEIPQKPQISKDSVSQSYIDGNPLIQKQNDIRLPHLSYSIPNYQSEEEKGHRTPMDRSFSNISEKPSGFWAKSNLRTPDNMSASNRGQPQKKKVTYAPLPEELTLGQSGRSPPRQLLRQQSSPPILNSRKFARDDDSEDDLDDDISNVPGDNMNPDERKKARSIFLKSVRRGTCTLKELIDQFYILEEFYTLKKFMEGLCTEFAYAQAMSSKTVNHKGQKPLTLKGMLVYGTKIKFIHLKQHNCIEILRNESKHNNITFPSFIKLLILASCGGDRSKIGIKNFKRLMNHMDIYA